MTYTLKLNFPIAFVWDFNINFKSGKYVRFHLNCSFIASLQDFACHLVLGIVKYLFVA